MDLPYRRLLCLYLGSDGTPLAYGFDSQSWHIAFASVRLKNSIILRGSTVAACQAS